MAVENSGLPLDVIVQVLEKGCERLGAKFLESSFDGRDGEPGYVFRAALGEHEFAGSGPSADEAAAAFAFRLLAFASYAEAKGELDEKVAGLGDEVERWLHGEDGE